MMAVFALLLGLCAYSKDVTIFVIEEDTNRTSPPYDYAANITNLEEDAVLIDVMKKAANSSNFTYEAILSDPCGYDINGINGVMVDSSQYWQILKGEDGEDFAPLCLGGRTSNYYPANGEEILFRLATWDGLKKIVILNVTGDSMNNGTNDTGYVIRSPVNATLIDVMNIAVAETNFTYNATFMKYGYFITSTNGLTAMGPEYWAILDGDMINIPVGASCYVPENGTHVLFELETNEEVAEDTQGITDELILVIVLIVVFVVSIVIAILCKITLK
jgi:hypothetical protein